MWLPECPNGASERCYARVAHALGRGPHIYRSNEQHVLCSDTLDPRTHP